MRPRSQTDFSGIGVRPWHHPAVTNGVRTEQQRKFPLFSLILLPILPLFALSSGLEAAAGAGRRGQHVPGGSAPLVEPRVHLHRPFLVLSQGLLFLLEHEGKAALNLNTKGSQSSAAAGSSPPAVLCHLARGHHRPSACTRTRGRPRGTVGQAGTDRAGPSCPGLSWSQSSHPSCPALLREQTERWGLAPRPSTVTCDKGHLLPPWALAGLELGTAQHGQHPRAAGLLLLTHAGSPLR